MPELPEVEVIRRSLEPHLRNRRVTELRVTETALRRPLLTGVLRQAVVGARITGLERRAKYLLVRLIPPAAKNGSRSSARRVVVIHLGMSGRLTLAAPDDAHATHEHVVFELETAAGDRRSELRFRDPRRFGLIEVLDAATWEESELFRHLGPEPLDPQLGVEYFIARAHRRRAPIKTFLMDARIVVGVGNIYASEALFRAGVDPRRPAGRIGRRRWQRLFASVQEVLRASIADGGTSFADYVNGEGSAGLHQTALSVYGAEGAPCPVCARRIRRLVQCGRSTFFCTRCQR